MTTWKRSLLGATLLFAALSPGCSHKQAEGATAAVSRGDLVASQSFHGELVAKTSLTIAVPKVPRVDAMTIKTVLADGAQVKKGDVVATFETTELEDNLRTAETDLLIARAELGKAEHGLDTEKISLQLDQQRRQMAIEEARLRLVEGVNLISELERKKADVNLRSAEIELKLATTALSVFAKKRSTALSVVRIKVSTAEGVVADNKAALERLALKAPADGVIYKPYVLLNYARSKAEPGRVCRAGDKILELPDLHTLQVTLQVRPRDAARIRVGDEARVYVVAMGDRLVPAKVLRKDDFATTRNERYGTKTSEGNLKEIAVMLELGEQPEGMRPGGTVRAELSSVLKTNAVLVPLWALTEERDGHGVVTLASGERREIDLGASSATHAEVLKGLSGGEVLKVAAK